MTLSIIIMVVLGLLIFGFVLEPIIRTQRRGDTILDTVDVPESVASRLSGPEAAEVAHLDTNDEIAAPRRTAVNEPGHAEGSS